MHLRRALLLFAVVLGLAAVTASVSRPGDPARDAAQAPSTEQPRPTAEPQPSEAAGAVPAEPVTLDAAAPRRRQVEVGRPVTLKVTVDEPGQVEIPALGLNAYAEPLTPARFELLPAEPGRLRVAFTPASDSEPQRAGTLLVRES